LVIGFTDNPQVVTTIRYYTFKIAISVTHKQL
jgi:hypothetical protein